MAHQEKWHKRNNIANNEQTNEHNESSNKFETCYQLHSYTLDALIDDNMLLELNFRTNAYHFFSFFLPVLVFLPLVWFFVVVEICVDVCNPIDIVMQSMHKRNAQNQQIEYV